MTPLILLGGLIGIGGYLVFRKTSHTVKGPPPIFGGTPQARVIKATSGFFYDTELYPPDASNSVKATAMLIGFTNTLGQTTQVGQNPPNWVAYSQDRATGKRKLISMGSGTTPATLKDFGLQ